MLTIMMTMMMAKTMNDHGDNDYYYNDNDNSNVD